MTDMLTCPECSAKFVRTSRARQAFCCTEHKAAFNDLMRVRGRLIMPLLLARSMGRHTRGDQRGAYCRKQADALIARWNIEDRERPGGPRRPDIIARHKMDMLWSSVDVA